MANDGLQIPVGFTVDEARAQLKQLEAAAASSGRQIQSGMRPATESVGGFGDMLKKVAREERSEGRVAAFYVSEISQIVPVTGLAKTALNEFAQAAVGGFGALAVGVGAVKLLSEAVREHYRAELENLARIEKATAKRKADLQEIIEKQRDLIALIQASGSEEGAKLVGAMNLYNEGMQEGVRQRAMLESGLWGWRMHAAAGQLKVEKEAQQALVDSFESGILRILAIGTEGIAKLKAQQAANMANPLTRFGGGTIGDQVDAPGSRVSAAEVTAADERRRKQIERGKRDGEAYWTEYYKVEAIIARQHDQERSQVAFRNSQSMTSAADQQRLKGMQGMGGMTGAGSFDVKDFAAEKARERQELLKTAQTWQQYGEAAGSAISGLMTGTKTFGQVMAEVMQQVLQQLYQWAVSAIMKNAGVAGSEAAAQNSSQGPYGWIIGIGAMSAIFSAVMALIGQIGSAETGAVLPTSGGPFPFILHPNEWVLPADKAKGLDQLIASGGGGRSQQVTNITNIHAMDARSFEDFQVRQARASSRASARIRRRRRG